MCLNQLVQVVSVDGRGCADGVVDGRAESRVVRLSLVVLELEGARVTWVLRHAQPAPHTRPVRRLQVEGEHAIDLADGCRGLHRAVHRR